MDAQSVKALVDAKFDKAAQLARDIWNYAELPYEEEKSAAALIAALEQEGFSVEKGVADMPTAFVATFQNGEGGLTIGLLGEYDALSSLSQKAACTVKTPVCEGAPGHGCGHNLLGAGALAAAVAVKDALVSENKPGKVVYFGCPAEEGAGSKQFMARAGCFDGVDFCITWHPSTVNEVLTHGSLAIMGANFAFDGVASHAGASPHLGRSALDAVELMNVGCNYLREHVIDAARIHYAYSDAGGTAPNVVQAHAVVKYGVRAPRVSQMKELFDRVVNVARGAALMTDTKLTVDITMAFSDFLPNLTLAAVAYDALCEVGAPVWDEADFALAADMLHTYGETTRKDIHDMLVQRFPQEDPDALMARPLHTGILPFDPNAVSHSPGSTDVGDVSYVVPTAEIHTATACLGNVGHSWQNTAFSNSSVGEKGMRAAAQAMALTCLRIAENPDVLTKAWDELKKKNGGGYVCPLPDEVTPPVGRY